MSIAELFLLALGLSMDAVAVAICKGLSMDKMSAKNALIVGAWFGGFQALMPLIGYYLGTAFAGYIKTISHVVAFVLLAAIGINMIREAFSKKETDDSKATDCSLSVKAMFLMAVATSIDALAIGVTFAFLKVSILPAVLTIGVMTFVLSMAGVKLGNVFGAKYQSTAEIFGGAILCLLGVKILLEQFGIYIL
ncbi:Putative Mn2+ efflux pump MntP [Sporobacter termitidis DSM 10068]|uniref:Putative manganese efflux pump MntP n=1 Tax=Sporobacter termitidis DSM 10068 TaxID=1123282 RepID=A0A1M5Y5A5_9FIRM|nr:manganese efflux pump MntP family protein [Sporobacter termitidis]SHI07176.1 Putative Mn2+ efflux pump MntP [Sporobacter termitidis DSM 10068]